jgi:hypothetical protein
VSAPPTPVCTRVLSILETRGQGAGQTALCCESPHALFTSKLPLRPALAHTPPCDGSGNLRLFLWRSGGPHRTPVVSTSTRGDEGIGSSMDAEEGLWASGAADAGDRQA